MSVSRRTVTVKSWNLYVVTVRAARLHAEAFLPVQSVGSGSYLVGQRLLAVGQQWTVSVGQTEALSVVECWSTVVASQQRVTSRGRLSRRQLSMCRSSRTVPRLCPRDTRVSRQLAGRDGTYIYLGAVAGTARLSCKTVTLHTIQYLGTSNGRIHVEWTAFRFHSVDCGTFTVADGTLTVFVCTLVQRLRRPALWMWAVVYVRPLKNAKRYGVITRVNILNIALEWQ